MTATTPLNSPLPVAIHRTRLPDLAPLHRAFIVDVWGVVCDGITAFPDAVDALARLREIGPVAFVSNTARRADALGQFLNDLGIGSDCYDILLSAGEACHDALRTASWQDRASDDGGNRGVFYLGPDRDRGILGDAGLHPCRNPGDAAAIVCTGMRDTLHTVQAHDAILAAGVLKGLPFICANPDRVVRIGDRLVPCAGALADRYKSLGGRVHQFGKPEPAIYSACIDRLAKLKPGLRPKDILAIGDGLETDIAGARRMGIPAALVGTGIAVLDTAQGIGENGTTGSAHVPDFVMNALEW